MTTFPIRIGKVRMKRKTRYRSPAAFNIMTARLLRASLSPSDKRVGDHG